MSNTYLDRAKILTEALPYIQRYNGKIVVVNCGGVAMDAELRDAVATDITMLRLVGIKVVLVHGIGPEVKQALAQSGRELVQKEGVYQIGPEAMEILQEVLCGKVNKSLVATLNKLGSKSIGLCGIDGGLMTARRLKAAPASWSGWTAPFWRPSWPRITPPSWPLWPRARTAARQCTASAPTSLPPGWRWR